MGLSVMEVTQIIFDLIEEHGVEKVKRTIDSIFDFYEKTHKESEVK